MTAEWKTKTPDEILDDVRGIMRYSREQNNAPSQEVYSESTFKHLLGLGYFPGIKLAPEYQAEEINARLAPKWPRILREIRAGILADQWCEHLAFIGDEPSGLKGLLDYTAGTPGLDPDAIESMERQLRRCRGTDSEAIG